MHWDSEVKVSKDMAFSRSTSCRVFYLASAMWWAPALQAHSRGKGGKGAVRGAATAKLLCKGDWLQRGHEHASIRHPPTSTCFVQELFQATRHHLWQLTVKVNLPLQGLIAFYSCLPSFSTWPTCRYKFSKCLQAPVHTNKPCAAFYFGFLYPPCGLPWLKSKKHWSIQVNQPIAFSHQL